MAKARMRRSGCGAVISRVQISWGFLTYNLRDNYANSIRNCFPGAPAALAIVCNVTDGLEGSKSRSNADRRVCIFWAIAVLVRLFFS